MQVRILILGTSPSESSLGKVLGTAMSPLTSLENPAMQERLQELRVDGVALGPSVGPSSLFFRGLGSLVRQGTLLIPMLLLGPVHVQGDSSPNPTPSTRKPETLGFRVHALRRASKDPGTFCSGCLDSLGGEKTGQTWEARKDEEPKLSLIQLKNPNPKPNQP